MKVSKGYTFDDVLLVPKYSAIDTRKKIDLTTDLGKGIVLSIPILSANMKTVTGPHMAVEMACAGGLGVLHRFVDNQIVQLIDTNELLKNTTRNLRGFHVCMSVGVAEEDLEHLEDAIMGLDLSMVCVDVAHGDHALCMRTVETIAKRHSKLLLIAGNVATGEGARRLHNAGADVIKVGVGPGSLCTTRIETGNGVPQLTALYDVWSEFQGTKYAPKVIADGGIRAAGDIVKALCFSDAVMLGNILAGTDESPGELITKDGLKYKAYVGSSTHKTNHIEGVAALVPYKGPVCNVLTKIIEGVKSGLSYQGASNLKELRHDPRFTLLSHAGLAESHPHDVHI